MPIADPQLLTGQDAEVEDTIVWMWAGDEEYSLGDCLPNFHRGRYRFMRLQR